MKNFLSTAAVAAALSLGALVTTTGTASAYVVCNNYGDCWHTDHRYRYHHDVTIQYHPDDWYFHRDWDHDNDHHWRNYHNGRGYWRQGVWISF